MTGECHMKTKKTSAVFADDSHPTVKQIMYDMYPEDYLQIVDKETEPLLEGTVFDLLSNKYENTQIRFIRPVFRNVVTAEEGRVVKPAFCICIDTY